MLMHLKVRFPFVSGYAADLKCRAYVLLIGPGLGIYINEPLVREAASKHAGEKAWRNAIFTGPDGCLREW